MAEQSTAEKKPATKAQARGKDHDEDPIAAAWDERTMGPSPADKAELAGDF